MVLWRDTTKLQRSLVKLVNSNKTNWDEFCLHIEQLAKFISTKFVRGRSAKILSLENLALYSSMSDSSIKLRQYNQQMST